MVVDDEGESHAGPCRWIWSGKGRSLGLDQETRVVGCLVVVADIWDIYQHEDMAERTVLPMWSRTSGTRV
jgi:hypothetical protein